MSKRRTHSPEFKARVAADHAMGLRNAAHLPVRPDSAKPVEAAAARWIQRAVHQEQAE